MPVVEVIPQKINRITNLPLSKNKRRVAAYARVSTGSDEQFTSFEAQVDYYTNFINKNPDWEMVKVYTDEGITGTSTKKREGFNKMINDALSGRIDLIVTKSVSRFARNTVDSLTTIRKLKEAHVEVFFEKENIYTLDSKGELLITIMSSLAQEESRSISENVTWGIRKGFSDGKVMIPYARFLGYEKGEDGKPQIVKEEAEIVKLIYGLFLQGESTRSIAKYLNEHKIPMPSKKKDKEGNYIYAWAYPVINSILTNEKYCGDAVLQKTFTVDYLTKVKKKNEGELPKYHVSDSHEFIIPKDEWVMVQAEMERRIKLGAQYSGTSIFSSKLICGDCGGFYGQKVWHSTSKYRRVILQCNKKFSNPRKCKTPTLTEEQIKAAFILSFNNIDKGSVIEDMNIGIDVLSDNSKIDNRIAALNIKLESILAIFNKMIKDNSETAQDQDEYQKQWSILKEQYDTLEKEVIDLQQEKKDKAALISRINVFKKALQDGGSTIEEFSSKLWTMLVEKVIVSDDGTLEFHYYSRYKNTVRM